MSPPIFTPDGSEVSEIVLPDGSTASEVIGPDGNVVFEAGPDIPDSVVDQFETTTDVTVHYSGETAGFDINSNSPVFEGQNSLKHGGSLNNIEIVSLEGDGLNYYPERGDWVQGQVRAETPGCRTGPILFASDTSSGYSFEVATNADVFRIRDTGTQTTLATGGSPVVGQTYTVDIYSNNTNIVAEWIDQSDDTVAASLSVTDSNHTGRGFGHKERDTGVSDDYRALKGYGLP